MLPLPGLRQGQQDMGAEGALAAARRAEQRELWASGQGLQRRGVAHLRRVATRAQQHLAHVLCRQGLFQGLAFGQPEGGVERNIDVGQLQRRLTRLVGAGVDLAQAQAGQIGDQRMQVAGQRELRVFGVLARLDDLVDDADRVAADEVPVAQLDRAQYSGAAAGLDAGGGSLLQFRTGGRLGCCSLLARQLRLQIGDLALDGGGAFVVGVGCGRGCG